MQKTIIYMLLAVSFLGNVFFSYSYFITYQEQQKEIAEENKIFFEKKLFSEDFKLKDYSGVKYTLEQEGRDIIKNAREFHSSPAILKGENYDKYLCAGFLYELSQKFWDPSAPIFIGMMDSVSKTSADAWQFPYSYEYVGGKILTDFTGDFDLDTKNYWEKINPEKLKTFFHTAFSEEALLGDIGFLYKNTEYLSDLKKYENWNSHIVKNLGVSDFIKTIDFDITGKTQNDIISELFSCNADIYKKINFLLENYEIYVDNKRIVLENQEFYYLDSDNSLGKKVIFEKFSQIILKDINLIHFFEGARVDSLFEFTCQGDFYPINILQINPRMIEKI